ncbi:MAG: hypothetical protein KAS77_01370, partial [Thermoplasmata archaeon]|nr:hypothetical protein [Thermoplasmata archaeon]
FYGIFTIGYQLTLETRADGEFITIYGRVLDYDEAYDGTEVYIGGVNVTVEGMNLTRVTDNKGRFTYPDVPGGKFTIRFFKRSWDEAINTTYISILYTEIDPDSPATFLVKITDLAPDRSRPVHEGDMAVLAEVMDWPNDRTVTLRVHATAFDQDLSTFFIQTKDSEGLLSIPIPYTNIMNYTFPEGADQSELTIIINDDQGQEYASTEVEILDHPLGVGGWEETQFPEVYPYIRGGAHTDGTERTVLVSSMGSAEFTWRDVDGSWEDWSPMTDGSAEFTYVPSGDEGIKEVEVMCRNITNVSGNVATVSMEYDTTAPILEPEATGGAAVTDETTFDPRSNEAPFIRHRPLIDGEDGPWSAWQLYMDEVLIWIDDSGNEASVTFEARDQAGNLVDADVVVEVRHQEEFLVNDYERFYDNLMICIPIQGLGILLAFLGGYMAFKRRRPNLVILGAIGALLAGYGIVGALCAAVALVFVMFSRDEFEAPTPPPEE